MQFLPSTWARWGADGNGDGRADPDNVFDAALAAGHYLCAGDRDLGRAADLDRAILSYNHSEAYLRLVRHWLEFYGRGVHTVPDGRGVIPRSPGAGGDTPATEPVGGGSGGKDDGGGGIVIGPDPSTPGSPKPSSGPSPSPTPSPTSPEPSPEPTTTPADPPTSEDPATEPPGETTSPTPDPSPSPTASDDCDEEPTATPDPGATPAASPCPAVPATPAG
ncbi:hypothetical protein SHKM778_75710 [Streptomyces sp. KM77-8]|uniref:Transglycosylase SLT domain-containing protein n=1 Tax=Streptomyces haneummycinicus TaxID=3074435 RepID=A0AAT9HUQ7_9ACTN